ACWDVTAVDGLRECCPSLGGRRPTILVVDAATLLSDDGENFSFAKVVVVGPEPDSSYARAALRQAAGAYVTRDRLGQDLGPAMRRLLGCRHGPCPTGMHATPEIGDGLAGR